MVAANCAHICFAVSSSERAQNTFIFLGRGFSCTQWEFWGFAGCKGPCLLEER